MITVAHPNQVAAELIGRDYVSYSALSLYQQCPLRFFFKYVAGLPEQTVAASLVFGGAIHRAVEFHFNELLAGNGPAHLDTLLAEYHEAWRERETAEVRFGKDDDQSTLSGLAERMLRAFQASEMSQPAGTILGVEEQFRGAFADGCPDLLARVDLLVETADALVISDLKTARSRWGRDQAEDAAGQLLLYSELVGRLMPGKPLRLEFVIITKAKEPVIDRLPVALDPKRAARMSSIAQRVWRAIEGQHFYPSPSPMNCPTCPFRAPCRAWAG